MATILLACFILCEVFFCVYSIWLFGKRVNENERGTKEKIKKMRGILSVFEFLIFQILILFSIVVFSFRWKMVYVLLLIRCIIAIVLFFNRKKEIKDIKTGKQIAKCIFQILIVTFALIPAFLFPQYKLPEVTGEHKIARATYTYEDTNRVETFNDSLTNRKITMAFWYPADAKENEKFPLVMFSHGSFGVIASNTSTYMELASHGYVVCSIDHPYHTMGTVDTSGKFTMVDSDFLNEIVDMNNGVYSEEEIFQLEQKLIHIRVPDMNFAIDTILSKSQESKSEQVFKLVDKEHIGLFGHSLGGAESAQVARIRDDIDGVIDLEGTMIGEYVDFKDGDYVCNKEPYPVPILNVYTDTVMDQLAQYPDYQFINRVASATAPASFEVSIKGANHMSLTDLPLFSPFLVSIINQSTEKMNPSTTSSDSRMVIETMNKIVLNFFDCYLKGEGEFTMAGEY